MALAFLISCFIVQSAGLFFHADLDDRWRVYKARYGRHYDAVDNIQRRVIWEKTMHFIEAHTQEYSEGLQTYNVGPNKFSDMALEEFSSIMNGYKETLELDRNFCGLYVPPKDFKLDELNKTVDWRANGHVTNIKDQGLCGSCYAFSATGSLEGLHYKITGELVSLSERNILDCSSTQGNKRCDGGSINNAFKYIIEIEGLASEKSYPYVSGVEKCIFERKYVSANMTSCRSVVSGSERDLQIAVALEGPISVAVDASQRGFVLLDIIFKTMSGIYDDPTCTDKLSHAVLVVGYGSEGGQDYWLIKNRFPAFQKY